MNKKPLGAIMTLGEIARALKSHYMLNNSAEGKTTRNVVSSEPKMREGLPKKERDYLPDFTFHQGVITCNCKECKKDGLTGKQILINF